MGQGGQAAAPGQAPGYSYILLWGSLIAIFYFLIIRPQQQQRKKITEMLNNLKKGDRVITGGGIHGRITSLEDNVVTVEIADKVNIKLNRSSVAGVVQKTPEQKPQKDNKNDT